MPIAFEKVNHVYMQGTPFASAALTGVDLSIRDGEMICLIGHTGSGKSTLTQHLNGLLKPTSGRLVVEDIEVSAPKADLRALRRRVGLVFQYPEQQLFEDTVEKDVAFGPKNLGLSEEEIREKVRSALLEMELDPDTVGGMSPFELSGGQRRRVAIAGVLAMDPKVLVLDEPSAGLDPAARAGMQNVIKKIHEDTGCTVILVTHNMEEAALLADRILVMDKGHIVLDGTPREVFSESKKLAELGLGVPAAAELSEKLRDAGIPIPEGILFVSELRAALKALGEGDRA